MYKRLLILFFVTLIPFFALSRLADHDDIANITIYMPRTGRVVLLSDYYDNYIDADAAERIAVYEGTNRYFLHLQGAYRLQSVHNSSATQKPLYVAEITLADDSMLRQITPHEFTMVYDKFNGMIGHLNELMDQRVEHEKAFDDRDIYKSLTFWSPNVNIFRAPRWGRGHETYGEDPMLTSEMGCAYVRGLQSDGETLKAAACARHFAVHSGPENIRHEFNAVATPRDMAETYLPAFKALVQKVKVESVMGAYNHTNGEPCCASAALMHTLRDEWGFEGHFTFDCWAIKDFHRGHAVTNNAMGSAALAVRMATTRTAAVRIPACCGSCGPERADRGGH